MLSTTCLLALIPLADVDADNDWVTLFIYLLLPIIYGLAAWLSKRRQSQAEAEEAASQKEPQQVSPQERPLIKPGQFESFPRSQPAKAHSKPRLPVKTFRLSAQRRPSTITPPAKEPQKSPSGISELKPPPKTGFGLETPLTITTPTTMSRPTPASRDLAEKLVKPPEDLKEVPLRFNISELVSDRDKLKRAVIYSEILNLPISIRNDQRLYL